jgi:tetratricopeptide (TPR) repeat protein
MNWRTTFTAIVVLSLCAPASAQSRADRRRAGALFQEGDALYAEEDWSGALAKFEESYATIAHVATKFNIAKCLEKLGRFAEADAAYAEVESGEDEELAASSREARARIAPRLRPADTEAAPAAATATEPPVDSEIVEDPDLSAEVSTSDFATDRLLLWGGVGLAAIGTSMTLIFGLRASALEEDVADARLSGPDPDDIDSGRSAATLANVGLVVAAVGVGAAAAGLLLGRSADGEDSARLTIGPGAVALSGTLP